MNSRQGMYAVLSAIAIQLIIGVVYIWSVFQTGIAESIFDGDNAAAGLIFSFLLAMLSIGSVIGGRLATKFSTRIVVFSGGIILSLGFFFASFATAYNSWILLVSYGIMGGLGMGFMYSTTIACSQKWYPHKKGLVTGVIVSAIGIGGVVFTPIVENLIVVFGGTGVGEVLTFRMLSAVFLVVCTIGSIFLINPPDGYLPSGLAHKSDVSVTQTAVEAVKSFTTKEMLSTPQFYLTIFTLLFACMGGLMMIAFARPIAVARGLEATATIGVLAISLFNSVGRLFWGMVSDRAGRINTILMMLFGSAILSLLVNAVNGYFIYVLIALIGFFYGGIIGTFPSLTADLFGAKFMATNYGVVLLGFGAGAIISSQIAGHYMNVAATDINLMFPAFVMASGFATVGIVMMLVLKRINKLNQQTVVQQRRP